MEELMLLVEPGNDLPEPGKLLQVKTIIGQKEKLFKVKSIASLRWNNKGALVCEIKGHYVTDYNKQ